MQKTFHITNVDSAMSLMRETGIKGEYHPPDKAALLQITETGEAFLNGETNWIDCDDLNKWNGGVQLYRKNIWLWEELSQSIVRP